MGGIGVSGLLFPTAIAVDASGALYFADIGYCKVYRQLNGTISTVAGNGQCLYSGDNGPAAAAGIIPADIALDGKGGLLIADQLNDRVRRVELATGTITTVAGIGTAGFSG
ncbi:MAG: hypothetical protein WDO18_10640 [Acidobacteriota bacterium]